MGLIYQCTNLINNKIYIGQTKRSLQIRKNEHLHKAVNDGTYFHNALLKYGEDNFQWEILGEYPDEELEKWEAYWIETKQSYFKLNKGYNMTTGDPDTKTTTNKKVRVFVKSKNLVKDYYSISEAARELTKEFAPLTFTCAYISKICHGQAYSYYKDFFFNFVDENGNIIPTNYVKKNKADIMKKLHKKQCIKVKAISPSGDVYYFNSLKELEEQFNIERHTARKSIDGKRPILSGKNKGWRVELDDK